MSKGFFSRYELFCMPHCQFSLLSVTLHNVCKTHWKDKISTFRSFYLFFQCHVPEPTVRFTSTIQGRERSPCYEHSVSPARSKRGKTLRFVMRPRIDTQALRRKRETVSVFLIGCNHRPERDHRYLHYRANKSSRDRFTIE